MSQHTRYSPHEERNWFLRGWLALIALNSLFTLVSFLTGGSNPLAYILPDQNTNNTAIVIANLASAATIGFCALILLGYRLGYYGLVIAYIILTIASLIIGFNIGVVLLAGLVALITWVLLRPAWPHMK